MQNDYNPNPHKKHHHHFAGKKQQPTNAPRPPRSVQTYDFARERALRQQMMHEPHIEIENPRAARPVVKLAGRDPEFYDQPRAHDKPRRPRKPIQAKYIWWGLTLILLLNFTAALIVDSRAFNKPAPMSTTPTGSAVTSATSTPIPAATSLQAGPVLAVQSADGRLLYTNDQYLFSLTYPAGWAKITAQTLNASDTDTVKPTARIVFETTATDPLTPKKEIMRLRIDSTSKYVSLVEANKANPTAMPTFVGKSGDNVISLETPLPAATTPAISSSTTPTPTAAATPAYDFNSDIRTVLASFTPTGANTVPQAPADTTKTPPSTSSSTAPSSTKQTTKH